MRVYVVGDYRPQPSEGMQVITAAVVDGLRAAGRQVVAVKPGARALPRLLGRRGAVIFTHGPGLGTVLMSAILRLTSPSRLVWIASRPRYPRPWKRLTVRSAHVVIGNRKHAEVDAWASDARFIRRFLGLTAGRLRPETKQSRADRGSEGTLKAIHLGHIRPNRGLQSLARAQEALGGSIRTVVYASPTFAADQELVRDMTDAGVEVSVGVIDVADAYEEADVYVFPVEHSDGGAVELPLTVLEALAAGVPVVTTRYGVLPDALEGHPGVTFYEGVAELVDALRSAASRKAAGDALVAGDFPRELRMESVIEALQEVLP